MNAVICLISQLSCVLNKAHEQVHSGGVSYLEETHTVHGHKVGRDTGWATQSPLPRCQFLGIGSMYHIILQEINVACK